MFNGLYTFPKVLEHSYTVSAPLGECSTFSAVASHIVSYFRSTWYPSVLGGQMHSVDAMLAQGFYTLPAPEIEPVTSRLQVQRLRPLCHMLHTYTVNAYPFQPSVTNIGIGIGLENQ